ncbi:MAG: hypothetical protein JWO82_3015 [Akkermansiaceae bacterium]|nr:hypothetical protein [Akkermansiaceae bacterium]
MTRTVWIGVGMLALLAMVAGWWGSKAKKPVSDMTFQNDLVRAIGSAQEIRLTEHSSPHDWGRKLSREHVYRTKVLSPESRAKLAGMLAAMDPAPQEAIAACVPLYHHTIEFTGSDEQPVLICFGCGQIKWREMAAPGAAFQVLGDFLESEGFERSRDWNALAEAAEKEGTQ